MNPVKTRRTQLILFTFLCVLLPFTGIAQNTKSTKLAYVDKAGRLRWTKGNTEVYLFGVNYTVPFAYGYRSVKAINPDIEKEIDKDVYHLSRMGADAFRVHIWDTEITDTAGNLLQNDHLKLFDYLVYRLKQRNIKIIITPIAFWGNGYPEKDEHTAGFSSKYNKGQSTVNENAIKAQENYIKQLLQHVNPYTKLTYRDEPDIIAAELNNEPSHSGPKSGVTNYVNRLAAAAKSTGWDKPLFYNISQSPYYGDAVAKSNVDGFSFQWYPTGLVAGHEQKGNYLPNVDRYTIPFDTIPEFKNKVRMIYEFDVADLLPSYLYPAVARSFKQAGFQWVTQFAYDPLATAYGNTEYQTHFLNLAYTPAKAISFLIANRVFHSLPLKDYGTYPADSVFNAYHVSYKQAMSEMNTATEFYYSGTTATVPAEVKKMEHLAGVGSSVPVKYQGSGAYFLDKLENGIWRLEVMPDAITVRDPFEKPSPSREAVHIQWQEQQMQIDLADIGNDFTVKGINATNEYTTVAAGQAFVIKPGTYLVVKKGKATANQADDKMMGNIRLNEFVAPAAQNKEILVSHTPLTEVSAGKSFVVNAKVINIDPADKVSLLFNRSAGAPAAIDMERAGPNEYKAVVSEKQVVSGILNYRIIVRRANNDYIVFPGGHKGDPYQWDNTNTESWQTYIATPGGKLVLFSATADRGSANPYFPGFSRNGGAQFISGEKTGQLVFKVVAPTIRKGQAMGLQQYIADKLKGRTGETASFTKVVVRARQVSGLPAKFRVALIHDDASAYAAYVDLSNDFKDIEIPLSAFRPDSSLLLPRPYPDFMPVWFKATSFPGLNLARADKLEFTVNSGTDPKQYNQPLGIEVESVWLER
jgi:hypothetical protein